MLRDVTERHYSVQAGMVKLVGTNHDNVMFSAEELLNNKKYITKCVNKLVNIGSEGI